jgi:alginate O-acetyltransferase complex protein AlgI
MTLSRWFRDYVLLPLVGRRPSKLWALTAILIVFFLTGLWHGASWTFAFWGLYNGVFLVVERLGLRYVLRDVPAAVANIYLLLVATFGAVIFRSTDMAQVGTFYRSMFLFERGELAAYFPFARYFDAHLLAVLIAASILSVPVANWRRLIRLPDQADARVASSRIAMFWILLAASIISVGASSYTPFLYFRF